MGTNLPTRDAVILKIRALRELRESRESVAAWAMSIIDDDMVEITDRSIWRVLKNLGAVDLPADDRPYLYMDEDFAEWEAELG